MMDSLWGLKRRHNELETVGNPDHDSTKNFHRSLKSNITSLYGGETWKEICLLEILRIKIERRAADLQFLKQCRNKKIIPPFAKINHRLFNHYNNKLFLKLSLALIRSEIKRTRAALDRLNHLALSSHLKLTMEISFDLWKIIDAKAALKAQSEGRIARERQSRKLAKLEEGVGLSTVERYSTTETRNNADNAENVRVENVNTVSRKELNMPSSCTVQTSCAVPSTMEKAAKQVTIWATYADQPVTSYAAPYNSCAVNDTNYAVEHAGSNNSIVVDISCNEEHAGSNNMNMGSCAVPYGESNSNEMKRIKGCRSTNNIAITSEFVSKDGEIKDTKIVNVDDKRIKDDYNIYKNGSKLEGKRS